MQTEDILNSLKDIAHNPFFMFMGKLDEREDNRSMTLNLSAREDKVTLGRISEVLDIKPSSVTQMIKKLSHVGIVERTKSDQDARVTYIKLTIAGKKLVDARQNITSQLHEVLFKEFSQEELTALSQGIDKLAKHLDSQLFYDKLTQEFGNDERWQMFEKINARMGQARGRMMREFDFRGGHLYDRPHMWGGYDMRRHSRSHQSRHADQDRFSDDN